MLPHRLLTRPTKASQARRYRTLSALLFFGLPSCGDQADALDATTGSQGTSGFGATSSSVSGTSTTSTGVVTGSATSSGFTTTAGVTTTTGGLTTTTGGLTTTTGGLSNTTGAATTGDLSTSAGLTTTGIGVQGSNTTASVTSNTSGDASTTGSATTEGVTSTTGGDPTSTTGEATSGTTSTTGDGTGGASTTGASTTATSTSTTGSSSVGKFVGNITTSNNVDTNGRTFSTYWDQITPENAGKWGSVQSSASSGFNWSALDAIYDYTEATGIIFKEHVFVWGAQQPSGTLTETHVRTWISEFCTRYPNTALIDVVNEPPPHTTPSYADAIGGGTNSSWQWIINAFNWARESCPNAILILNDYNNIEYADQNQHFIDIANAVKNSGAPIDAVGAQAHGLSGSVSASTMQNLTTKLHNDTGLPVYITEYDIDLADDNAQLAKYQEHFPFFLDTEWIHGITIWGWIYGSTWIPASGLIRNGSPRPAMTWLMDELGRPAP